MNLHFGQNRQVSLSHKKREASMTRLKYCHIILNQSWQPSIILYALQIPTSWHCNGVASFLPLFYQIFSLYSIFFLTFIYALPWQKSHIIETGFPHTPCRRLQYINNYRLEPNSILRPALNRFSFSTIKTSASFPTTEDHIFLHIDLPPLTTTVHLRFLANPSPS